MKTTLSSLSAIPLKTYRNWSGRKLYNPKLYEKLFKFWTKKDRAYRIYLPVGKAAKPHNTQGRKAVEDYLNSVGYQVEDYLIGMAVHKDNGRTMKIGKILSKGKQTELKRVFDNDKSRQAQSNQDMYVVVSRHPYDIAGMSTGRDWESCLNIVSGSNKTYTQYDVEAGHLVAYLIEGSDKNINRPLARVRLMRYESKGSDKKSFILHRQEKVYGNANSRFLSTIDEWLAKVNPKDAEGSYCIADGIATYNDGMHYRLDVINEDTDLDDIDDSEVVFKNRATALRYLNDRWENQQVTRAIESGLVTDEDLLSMLDKPLGFDYAYKNYVTQLARSSRVASIALPLWEFALRIGQDTLVLDHILSNSEVPASTLEGLLSNIDLETYVVDHPLAYLSSNAIDVIEKLYPGLVWKGRNVATHSFTTRHVGKILETFTDDNFVEIFLRGESVKFSVVKTLFAAYLERPNLKRDVLGAMLGNSVFSHLPRPERKTLALNVAISYDTSIVASALSEDPVMLKELALATYKATGLEHKVYIFIREIQDIAWSIENFGVDVVIKSALASSSPFLEPTETLTLLNEGSFSDDPNIVTEILSRQLPRRYSNMVSRKYEDAMVEVLSTFKDTIVLNNLLRTQAPPHIRNLRTSEMFSKYLDDHVEHGSPIDMDMTNASDNVIYELADNIEALNLIDPIQLAKILVRTSNNTMEDAAEQLMEAVLESDILPDVVKAIYDINIPLGDDTKEILEEGFMDSHPELEDLVRDI